MKHRLPVTLILIVIFALSQIIGLYLVAGSMEEIVCTELEEGISCETAYENTAVGGRPDTEGFGSILYLIVGIAVGTGVLLLLAKFGKTQIWKGWFFVAIWMSVAIALGTIFNLALAWGIALVLAVWKIWKPNVIVYNVAEILMYSGLAILIVPILDVTWMLVMLGIISVYDMIAVWKSKHMVTMAKFITNSNAFAGLVVPYTMDGKKEGKKRGAIKGKISLEMKASKASSSLEKESAHKNAILGGGDITFPLLFAGTVLDKTAKNLVAAGVDVSVSLGHAYFMGLLVAFGATLSIALLLVLAKKDRFYPAMPFVSAGCVFGWALTFLF